MGTPGEEGLDDGGSAVGARQLELRANSGLAAGTMCVPAAKLRCAEFSSPSG